MLKFTQLSQQMGTKQTQANQTPKKTTGKENSNPNPQNTILKTVSTTGAVGTRHTIISPNTLIQAATKNNRHFRAMVSHNLGFSSCLPFFDYTSSCHNVHSSKL